MGLRVYLGVFVDFANAICELCDFGGDILGRSSKTVILLYDSWANLLDHSIVCICGYLGVFVDFTNTICGLCVCVFYGYPRQW